MSNLDRHNLTRLRTYSRRLNRMISTGDLDRLPEPRRSHLVGRIRRLCASLGGVVPEATLKSILAAGAAIVLGVSACSDPGQGGRTPTFAAPVTNPFGLSLQGYYTGYLACADIDGDGDYDLFVGSYEDSYYGVDALSYLENTGSPTSPAFAAPVGNPFGFASSAYMVIPTLADLDGDGDMDLVTGEIGYYSMTTRYRENTGTPGAPAFAAPSALPTGLPNWMFGITFGDIDDDGDLDILSATSTDYVSIILFHANVGTPTSPSFASALENPFGLTSTSDYAPSLALADLDMDGDLDLLAASYGYYTPGGFFYFQNTGSRSGASFAPHLRNPFGLRAPTYMTTIAAVDIDGDGDIDVFYSDYDYDTGAIIKYQENTTI